ncbi:MAG TPA: signal peptidase I [Solirubrobacteraceae bacterium]|nr:signal peptidase I [Solirubrobacteraceae bacterium]
MPRVSPRTPAARQLRALAAWAALGGAFGLVLLCLAHPVFGLRSFTVMSGSMEPAIRTGDLVVNRPIAASDARIGDVITFHPPTGPDRVTHRVHSMIARGGSMVFETKGDANTSLESWKIGRDGHIGRVVLRVRRFGWVVAWLRQPVVLLLIIVLPAVGLGIWELIALWRPVRQSQENA